MLKSIDSAMQTFVRWLIVNKTITNYQLPSRPTTSPAARVAIACSAWLSVESARKRMAPSAKRHSHRRRENYKAFNIIRLVDFGI